MSSSPFVYLMPEFLRLVEQLFIFVDVFLQKVAEVIFRQPYNKECTEIRNVPAITSVGVPYASMRARLKLIPISFSFLITDKCNRIVPRVGHLNRAGHLFLKRFERAVDFNNFRILLGLDSQDFHNSTSQNQNINRAVSSENAICDVGTHRLDHSTEDRPRHSINTIRPYAPNAAP